MSVGIPSCLTVTIFVLLFRGQGEKENQDFICCIILDEL